MSHAQSQNLHALKQIQREGRSEGSALCACERMKAESRTRHAASEMAPCMRIGLILREGARLEQVRMREDEGRVPDKACAIKMAPCMGNDPSPMGGSAP